MIMASVLPRTNPVSAPRKPPNTVPMITAVMETTSETRAP